MASLISSIFYAETLSSRPWMTLDTVVALTLVSLAISRMVTIEISFVTAGLT